jgi:hypothetical protein
MDQNTHYRAAISTYNDLVKQQQQMTDDEAQLSNVCFGFVFCCLLIFD